MPPMPTSIGDNNVWWGVTDYSDGIRIGMYALYLHDWLEVFPRKSFVFIKYEEYAMNKSHVINTQVLPFLKLRPLGSKEKRNKRIRNRGKYRGDMLLETRKTLDEFYAPFNNRLAQLFGDPKWLWSELMSN